MVDADATVWLWMVACAKREDVTGCAAFCTGFCALTLCVAWLRTVPAWSGCDVMAEETVVEEDRPASMLYASLGTAHCTTTPTEPEGCGSA